MTPLKIDPEFRDKIPPLSDDEFKRLEENIIADGAVREPLVVWNGAIIDGHHRWKIIQKHPEIPYTIKEMDFADKWAAISWMCSNQLGRRNVTPLQKSVLIGEQAIAISKSRGGQIGNKNAAKNESAKKAESNFNELKGHYTTAEMTVATEHGVKPNFVQKSIKFAKGLSIADSVSPGFKESVLKGEIEASKESITKLRNLDGDELKEAVEELKKPKEERKPKAKPNYADGSTRKTFQLIRELSEDAGNINKETTYEIEDVVNDLEALEDNFINQIRFVFRNRADIINECEETKEKVIAFIEGAMHDLNRIKEEM